MDLSIIDSVADLKKIVVSKAPENATVFTVRITEKSAEMEYDAIEGMERLRSEDHFQTNVIAVAAADRKPDFKEERCRRLPPATCSASSFPERADDALH
jgi:hypothetical protein